MKRIWLAATCVTLVFVGVASFAAFAPAKPAEPHAPSFENYRAWRLVNTVPFHVSDKTAALCFRPVTPQQRAAFGPHNGKYIHVYVNAAGRSAMLGRKPVPFPEGSIIVKQKMSAKNGPVELLTCMVKGKRGSNPKTGNWTYYVTDASGAKITAQGEMKTCVECHANTKSSDYVYRTYLPKPDGSPATPERL
jgi:hypothetical protein